MDRYLEIEYISCSAVAFVEYKSKIKLDRKDYVSIKQ